MILEHVCIAMVHNWCFCDFWVGAWWTKKFRRHMLQAFKLSIGKLWNPKLLQGVVNPQQNRLISMGSTPPMGPLYDYIIWRVIPRLVIIGHLQWFATISMGYVYGRSYARSAKHEYLWHSEDAALSFMAVHALGPAECGHGPWTNGLINILL